MGQLAIVILVLFSYPLQVHPCRNCLDKVFHAGHVHPPVKTVADAEDEEEEEEEVEDAHAESEMSSLKHTLLTSAIIVCGFTIAYLVDDLQMGKCPFFCCASTHGLMWDAVLSFVGSTGSTTISFILPGLMYWKLTRDDPAKQAMNRAALGLAIYGAFIFMFWCVCCRVFREAG
ncbi:hypothetical protein H0H81_005081 [Sphagnurus paluster]|uniref:Amino acid transporter transmembrane domain-containing protein n=1 Tax=Sphagnurus paluster TaxID=117069 RepID=A0A9P7K3Y9_9AGAR|nr:hypothetical protein H0H81_005081 [Sphagnurus paluster]